MLDKLQQVEARYQELTSLLGDPATISDREIYRKFTKEHAEIEPGLQCCRS